MAAQFSRKRLTRPLCFPTITNTAAEQKATAPPALPQHGPFSPGKRAESRLCTALQPDLQSEASRDPSPSFPAPQGASQERRWAQGMEIGL